MKVYRIEDVEGVTELHAPGADANDVVLCGLTMDGDTQIVTGEAVEVEGQPSCQACLEIIRHCAALNRKLSKK